MRIPHIYTDLPITLGGSQILSKEKSHHISRVLRLSPGHPLTLFCADGYTYQAEISQIDSLGVKVIATAKMPDKRESKLGLTLVQSICRGEKMDWIVQKATELGVSNIVPLFSERTEVKLSSEKSEKKRAHWQAISIAAAEQAKRQHVPHILSPVVLDTYLANNSDHKERHDQNLHATKEKPPAAQHERSIILVMNPHTGISLQEISKTPNQCAILIGPEGGFSEKENALFDAHQLTHIKMGPRILRTETAAITAMALCQAHWGDLG